VHRISNWLGWTNSKTPEQTRTQLESFLPERVWGEINSLLVGYGQTLCRPVGPKCDICVIREFCPTGNANLSTSSSKKKKGKTSSESD
jgi:endonuclease-3